MKKVLIAILCLALALCSLAGCGNDKDNNVNNDADNLFTVADFTGKTEKEVTENADYKDSYTFEVVTAHSSTVEAGKIISHLPEAGETFRDKPLVTLTVSLGPKIVEVPDVIDKTEEEAKKELEEIGFNVIIYRENHNTAPEGVVYAIDPVIGEDVYNDASVSIYVSAGRAFVEYAILPDLKGLDQIEAERQIAEAELVLGTVNYEYSDTVPSGNVISTNPVAGEVSFGATIDLVISNGPNPEF